MTDVFISYSRKDIAFARLLHQALKENKLETWIDWQDIPPSADWLAEVYEAIEGADAFVFVISETSLNSEICGLEINHAAKHNKRLIPIVIKDVDAGQVPKELAVLNWIFFEEAGEKFAEAMEDLVTAITADQPWIKTHTRFENRALEWEKKERDRGLLLRGGDLTEAETWLAGSAGKDPQPTALQTQYILKSREDATRRQRRTLLGVGAALVVAIGLGILAWTQRNLAVAEGYARATAQYEAIAESEMRATAESEALVQRDEAQRQRSIAVSRQLAAQGDTQIEGHPDLALLLNVESCRTTQTIECRSGLLNVLTYQPFLDRVLHSSAKEPEFNLVTGYTSPSRAAFSPDSSLLAAVTGDNTIVLWDVITGERVGQPFDGHISEATALAFNHDGSILASATGFQTVLLWDVDTGEIIGGPLRGSVERDPQLRIVQALWGINSLAFSADGERIIAGCGNEDIIVWDVTTGERVEEHLGQQPPGVPHWLHATAFSPDTSIMTSGLEDGSVALYNVMTGQRTDIKRLSYEGPSRFTALAYSPDNQMVAGADLRDDAVILWDLTADKQVGNPLEGHTSDIITLVFSPDGSMLASAGYDTTIILWDVEKADVIGNPLTGHTAKVIGLDFSLDGRWLASLDALGNTLLWNLAGEEAMIARRFEGDSRADSIAFDVQSNEETLVSALCGGGGESEGWECVVRRWDVASGAESADPIKVYWPEVVYPELSPDGAVMVSSGDLRVVFWDTLTGEQIDEPGFGRNPMAFSPESESLAIWRFQDTLYSGTKTVSLWDIYRHQQIGESLSGQQDDLRALVFSPNGKILAGGSESGEVVLWDIGRGDPAPQSFVTRDEGKVWDLAFSPDGHLLAAGSEGAPVGDVSSIELWDVATGQSLWPAASDQPEDVNSLIFSPDGTMLVTWSKSGSTEGNTLALWDVASGRMIGWLGNGGDDLIFSADSDTLITASRGEIILWDINLDVWQEHACHIANRNMTASEWETYLPDQPCRPTCSNLPDLCTSN